MLSEQICPNNEDMNQQQTPATEDGLLFSQIKQVLEDARRHVARTVNTTMVKAYWQVGKYIVEYEQQGKERAEYGKGVIKNLSERLMKEYGSGFSVPNIKLMRQFYLYYPIGYSVSSQLTWTHWRALLRVQNEVARNYYIEPKGSAEAYRNAEWWKALTVVED